MSFIESLIAAKAGGGSGGSSGPADWNTMLNKPFYEEDDGTIHHLDPKYIKDMYYEETSIVEVLPETTYVSDPDVNHGEVVGAVIGLEAGKPYIVNWNGTEYTCVGVPIVGADVVALGNVGAIDGEVENTDEPFVIADAPSLGVMRILPLDGLTSVTVSIFEVSATVKTIDPKYLPDTVATKADLEAAIGTAIGGSY